MGAVPQVHAKDINIYPIASKGSRFPGKLFPLGATVLEGSQALPALLRLFCRGSRAGLSWHPSAPICTETGLRLPFASSANLTGPHRPEPKDGEALVAPPRKARFRSASPTSWVTGHFVSISCVADSNYGGLGSIK